jgi:uncharacterized protein involved in exopolysaccharide biosynthesis
MRNAAFMQRFLSGLELSELHSMNDTQMGALARDIPVARDKDVLDFLIVLAKNKRTVLGVPLLVGILAGAGTFALPEIYKANTKLLPPQQAQSGAAALLSQLGGVAGAAAGAAGVKSPNDLYIGMLKSRRISDKLVVQFNLQRIYGVSSLEKARKELDENTSIVSGRDSLITIEVEDTDPRRAANIANAYTDELMSLTKTLAVTEAAQRRLFFERQLEATKNKLAASELTLKNGLETGGVISVDSDSRALVETISRLRAQVSAKEIRISSLRSFVTTDNYAYKREEEELRSLKAELSKLENGRGETNARDDKQRSGLENVKVLRDVKYNQMLYELLAKQFEAARLDEAKDSSVIQVLDAAAVPERKIRPKRAIVAIVAASLAFVLAAALTVLRERNAGNRERSAKWTEFRKMLLSMRKR